MRFAPQFGQLPDSVPEELYETVKVKKVKPLPLESPNADQKQLIRSVCALLPEKIFFDPMVFPQREGVLIALSQLSETDQFVGGWLDTSYACLPDPVSPKLVLLSGNGHVLIEGTSGELLSYAMRYCRKAVSAIVHTHRMGYVRHPQLCGVLDDDLRKFRGERLFCRGLDRISKIEELDFIDQDNTINKFQIEGMQCNDTVYHLGAGTNTSSSQRALLSVYQRVVLVDPRCRPGPDSKACTWQEILSDIPDDADIVSDVAYGDEQGLIGTDMKELVSELYERSVGRLVMVKIMLMKGYNARGVLHVKPRPHNLEVVVILDKDGDPLDDLYDELKESILTTNIERNRAMFEMAFMAKIKPSKNTSRHLKELVLQKPPRLPKASPVVRTPKKSRNKTLGEAGRADAGSKRHVAWYGAVRNQNFNWDGPVVRLPNAYYQAGSLARYDPGLPDVDISLRSVWRMAREAGFKLHYQSRAWTIYKPSREQ